jgi:hypothetical protein
MSRYTQYSYPLCSEEDIISLVSEWEEMRKRFNSRPDRPLATGNKSWYDTLWVTLCGGLISEANEVKRRIVSSDWDLFCKFRQKTAQDHLIFNSLRKMMVNQSFFITENGFLGIGPPTTEPGDDVWILFGSRVPFVLRPRAENGGDVPPRAADYKQYTFVGDCFVNRIMDGQMLKDGTGKQETILLF